MATTITQAFVQQFKSNVIALYQQGESKLKGKFREESVNGDVHYFERLAATAAVRKTTRHGDTPLVDSQHSRRMVSMLDFEWADLVDREDKIRLLINPESEYAQNAARAFNRAYDSTIIEAITADAKAGVAGGTTVTFANDQLFDTDVSAADLDSDDILGAKQEFDDADVPEDGRVAIVTPGAMRQLLKDTKVVSSDYNSIKALVAGSLKGLNWMGFDWVVTTLCPTVSGDTDRYIFFTHRDSMGVAIGADPSTRISERADKSYSLQVFMSMTMGATRTQNGVGRYRVAP